jgi:hypothetical protein
MIRGSSGGFEPDPPPFAENGTVLVPLPFHTHFHTSIQPDSSPIPPPFSGPETSQFQKKGTLGHFLKLPALLSCHSEGGKRVHPLAGLSAIHHPSAGIFGAGKGG